MNSPYEQALDRIDSLTASRDQIEQDFYRLRDELSATRNELADMRRERDSSRTTARENQLLCQYWQAEAERWRKLSENTSLGRIEELESAVNRWETACREKDADIDKLLAQRDQAFAERDNWMDTAAQFHRNTEYYRGLVVRIGETLGGEARTCDDGTVADSVLCDKVPEVVVKRLAQRDEAIRERDTERRRANHNAEIAVEREEECQRLEAHIQKQHVASWHLVQDALGTDFRVSGNSLVEDTVNAINGFRDACELLDLIHDATNLREEVEP